MWKNTGAGLDKGQTSPREGPMPQESHVFEMTILFVLVLIIVPCLFINFNIVSLATVFVACLRKWFCIALQVCEMETWKWKRLST